MPCIIDNNKVIETPIEKIIDAVQQQLFLNHSPKLKDVIYKGNNVVVTCPHHKGGMEGHPACNVLLTDKNDDTPAGTAYCFACGWKANIVRFVAECLGISYRKATEWLLGFVEYSILGDKREIEEIVLDNESDPYRALQCVTIDELRHYDYVHPYMFQRGLTDELIDKFEIGYDPEKDAITFPVYVNGKCLFVARRYVGYKRFDLPKITPKPIYGVDYLTSDEVIVCESCFNALTCWKYGRQAVALFGTGSGEQIDMLNKLPQRKLILALDGDDAGKHGVQKLQRGLQNKIVTVLNTPTDGRDINDLSREEFESLEESFW